MWSEDMFLILTDGSKEYLRGIGRSSNAKRMDDIELFVRIPWKGTESPARIPGCAVRHDDV